MSSTLGRSTWKLCSQGHPLESGNLVKSSLKRGARRCLICYVAYHKSYVRKSRGLYRRGNKPFCKNGHPLTPNNLKGNKRECLTCHRERERQRSRNKGVSPRSNMVERGYCTAGHILTSKTVRNGRKECAICHRIRSRNMNSKDVVWYTGILAYDLCSYCGRPAEVFDHIKARALGGTDSWDNLTAACISCNAKKHAKPLLQFLCERIQ